MSNTEFWIFLIWNVVLSMGFAYLFLMHWVQDNINELIEESLDELVDVLKMMHTASKTLTKENE